MNSGSQTRQAVRRNSRKRPNPHRGITAEIIFKLILSWAIAMGAIASLFKLFPYHLTQQAKLKELRMQVQETDARVDKLKEQLNQNFDPQQTKSLMEQYSSLTFPNQSRIYWLPEDNSEIKNQ
ncbi:MAG: hypothetical protein ACFCU7_03255 [Pleurocapsa sp.]